jgi:hypothetical protein
VSGNFAGTTTICLASFLFLGEGYFGGLGGEKWWQLYSHVTMEQMRKTLMDQYNNDLKSVFVHARGKDYKIPDESEPLGKSDVQDMTSSDAQDKISITRIYRLMH